MTASAERTHRDWSATRARGKWRFILARGALVGAAMFLVMGVLIPWSTHSASEFTPRGYIVDAIVFPLGGLAWGWLVWRLSERNFRIHETRQRTKQQ